MGAGADAKPDTVKCHALLWKQGLRGGKKEGKPSLSKVACSAGDGDREVGWKVNQDRN